MRSPYPSAWLSRRHLLAGTAGSLLLAGSRSAWAKTAVPAKRQAELMAKAGKYDREMAGRAVDGRLRLMLVERRGSAESREFVLLAGRRLEELGRIGAHDIELVEHLVDDAGEVDDLSAAIVGEHMAMVVISTDLRALVEPLATSLRGHSVLTVAAAPEYVRLGAVLGFDLVNGTPALLVNHAQARAQGVDFTASFLELANIVE